LIPNFCTTLEAGIYIIPAVLLMLEIPRRARISSREFIRMLYPTAVKKPLGLLGRR